MSNKIWEKLNYYFSLIPTGILFGLVAYVTHIEIKDLDLWLHLGVGKFITLTRTVPLSDILSASIGGTFWNNHEWLFQVILYNIYNIWGANGLLNLQTVVVVVTMLLLLFLGYNRQKMIITTFLLMLVYLVFQQRFTIRPDLFSLLFFTIYIYILALHIDKKWTLPVLLIVQILWTNMHGFFFFGPLFVAIGLISEWIKRRIRLPYEWNESGRLTDEENTRMKILFVLVTLACLVNPLFIKGAIYPIVTFFSLTGEDKIFFDYIQELQKPVTAATIFDSGRFVYYKLLIFLSVVSFVLNRRRVDISALLFWLVFLVFSLKAARNTSFFAFAAYLVIITNVLHVDFKNVIPIRFTDKKFYFLTMIILNLLFCSWLMNYANGILGRSYYDFDAYETKSEFGGISLQSYPTKGADFLVSNNIKGNFFNDFNSGAYLIGRAFPNVKVYIDGRTEAYGGSFFKTYQKIWEKGNKKEFDKAVEAYNLTGAFLNATKQHIPGPVLRMLYDHPDWEMVYFDYDSVIFLKKNAYNEPFIQQHAVDLENWEVAPVDLMRFGTGQVKPYRNYYRAYTLESLKLYDKALAELEQAFKIYPPYADAHHLAGKIYAKKEDYPKAYEHFRVAEMLSPTNKEIRYNLALSLYDMGEITRAIHAYEGIHMQWPSDPKALLFLARIYAKEKKDFEESLMYVKKVVAINPTIYIDLVDIAKIFYNHKEYEKAVEIVEFAIKANVTYADAYELLSDIYKDQGLMEKAFEQLEYALVYDEGNEEIITKIEKMEEEYPSYVTRY